MKKFIQYNILILLLIVPLFVNAKAADGIISIENELIGDNISNHKFSFVLKDLNGKILQRKENNNNEVTFDPIKYTDSDVGNKYFYIVEEENDNKKNVTYDDSTIYVGVLVGEDSSEVSFVNPKWYNNKKQKANPFHATEAELQGQAYAVYDDDTKVLTFFRDEPNKYEQNQEVGNKVYFTDFEENNNYNWVYNNKSYRKIEKIIFKDAIRPNSIQNWFVEQTNLKELDIRKLDTSRITSLHDFLKYSGNLRHIDLTTMDVSNVTDLGVAFKGSGIEELDFSCWDLSHLKNTRPIMEFVNTMPNLKYLDISNFEAIDSSAEFAGLPCLEYVHLGNKFKFERAILDITSDFIKLEDNKIYSTADLRIPYNVDEGTIGGHYVRPSCTKKATFHNTYKKEKSTKKEEIVIHNPETNSTLIILITLCLLSGSLFIIKIKRKDIL